MNTSMPNRRHILQGALLASAVAAAPALSGCSPSEAPDPDRGESLGLPSVSTEYPVSYDITGTSDGIVPFYLFNYPTRPPVTVSQAPGAGGDVTAVSPLYTVPPKLGPENPALRAVCAALNSNLEITYVSAPQWSAKRQTMLASDDLPDLMPMNASVPRLPELLPKKFSDLSPYVAGAAIDQYPNLGLLPESAWRKTMVGGSIYGVPQPRARFGITPLRVRSDLVEPTELSDASDLIAYMKEVSSPKNDRWSAVATESFVQVFSQMLETPNGWEEDAGLFRHEFESDRYVEVLSSMADLWKKNLFHPDSFSSGAEVKYFDNGQVVMWATTGDPGGRYQINRPIYPNYEIDFMLVPRHGGGGTAPGRLSRGYFGMSSIPRGASPERIEELLRIVDWISAPYGSAEYTLHSFGLEGRHFHREGGLLEATELAKSEVVPLGYLGFSLPVFTPRGDGAEKSLRAMHGAIVEQYREHIDNPAYDLYSKTADRSGAAWDRRFADLKVQIVRGRSPVAEWTELVQSWRSEVGDLIRREYELAFVTR